MLLTDSIYFNNIFQQEELAIRRNYKESQLNFKYKTEVCKNWLSGECKFGEMCLFAHGLDDLKKNKLQKTKECKNFKSNFYCPYGDKCQFKHNHVEKKRLPIFANILLRSTLEDN